MVLRYFLSGIGTGISVPPMRRATMSSTSRGTGHWWEQYQVSSDRRLPLLPVERTLVVFIFGIAWWILLFFGAAFLIGSLSWTMLFLPLTLIPLVLLACGCSFFCAATTVYLRDTRQVVEVIAQILMFATPVFYQLSMISEKYRWIFLLNPLTIIVEETRKFFLFKTMPDFLLCGLLWCVSIVVFQFGYAWFTRLKR